MDSEVANPNLSQSRDSSQPLVTYLRMSGILKKRAKMQKCEGSFICSIKIFTSGHMHEGMGR